MTWKFEKYVGSCAINSQLVAKYVDDDMRIKLVIEDKETDTDRGERVFENREEYECWLEQVTNDSDWTYNGARVVNDIINEIV